MPTLTPRLDNSQSFQSLIINSNFDFWQRGTSAAFTSASPSTHLADRWSANIGTAGYTITTSRSTDVPTFAQSGSQSVYSHLITNGTAPGFTSADNNSIAYKVEGYDYAQIHGNKFRLQFWIKSSIAGTYSLSLRNSAANRSYVTPLTISSANTWEKKTFDIQADSSGTWVFDNGIGLRLEIYHTCGSNFQTSSTNQWLSGNYVGITGQTQWGSTTGATMQIAQVMLVPGSFDSSAEIPFKRAGKTIGDELRLCQRYYYDPFFGASAATDGYAGSGQAFGATSGRVIVSIPVTMRSSPTFGVSAVGDFHVLASTGGGNTTTNLTLEYATPNNATINPTVASGLAAGNAILLRRNSTAAALKFDSEI